MTTSTDEWADTLKDAIRNGAALWPELPDQAIEDIYTAVQQTLATLLPQITGKIFSTPAFQTQLMISVLAPALGEVEDDINDLHDKPTTPDDQRPGLRRAARLLRGSRRSVIDTAEKGDLAATPCTEQGHPNLTQNPALRQPCLRTGSHYVHEDATGNQWKCYADGPR